MILVKNGVQLPESKAEVTTNGSGRAELMVLQTLIEFTSTDYLEVWIENNTNTENVTVTELNTIIQ